MPTYEYHCAACDRDLEVVQSMRDDRLTTCPECEVEGRLQRKISGGAGIIFKGTGFYETDYKRSPETQAKQKAEAEGGSGSDSGSSNGSEGASGKNAEGGAAKATETPKGGSEKTSGGTGKASAAAVGD